MNPHRVLIIQDDSRQSEVMSEAIRETGDCHIDTMGTPDLVIQWSASFSQYHLVVVDTSQQTQKIDPLEILESIRRLSPVTSVIMVSEVPTIEQAVSAIRLGAEDYLQKPLNVELFKLAVKRSLDKKALFQENRSASNFLLLLNSCQMISATLDQSKIFGILRAYFSRELKSDHFAVYKNEDGNPLRIEESGGADLEKDRVMQEILDIAVNASNPIAAMASSNELYRFVERGTLTPGLFIFRFKCVGPADYYFVCLSPEKPTALDAFESRLRTLKTQIELTGRNIEQYLGVQHLVFVDDATGLYNTRYLSNILDREITQHELSGRPFAVLFMDGDRFKSINDTHGHLAGTKLLHELGNHLKKFVRERDTVFRYGGDEFVAVLSNCDLATAQTVAERIRKSVETNIFLKDEGLNIKITVSIGVALYPDHARTKKDVIEAADHAMYQAKNRTRNSVFIAPLGGKQSEKPNGKV